MRWGGHRSPSGDWPHCPLPSLFLGGGGVVDCNFLTAFSSLSLFDLSVALLFNVVYNLIVATNCVSLEKKANKIGKEGAGGLKWGIKAKMGARIWGAIGGDEKMVIELSEGNRVFFRSIFLTGMPPICAPLSFHLIRQISHV